MTERVRSKRLRSQTVLHDASSHAMSSVWDDSDTDSSSEDDGPTLRQRRDKWRRLEMVFKWKSCLSGNDKKVEMVFRWKWCLSGNAKKVEMVFRWKSCLEKARAHLHSSYATGVYDLGHLRQSRPLFSETLTL